MSKDIDLKRDRFFEASSLIFALLDSVYVLFPGLMGIPGALDDPVLAEETKQFILKGLGVDPDRNRSS